MSDILSRGNLFPAESTKEMISLVMGKSSLAKLAKTTPIAFNGTTVYTFNLDKEIDLVAENGAKTVGGATVAPITIVPQKVEYGLRVSDEFVYGSEEKQLDIMKQFTEGFAKKVARGLDIMAFHGVNPRTGNTAAVLNDNNFDAVITNVVSYDQSAPQDNVEAAIDLIESNEYDVTGMAMSPAFKSALKNVKAGTNLNTPLFPEIGWGRDANAINGLPVDANSTVSFNSSADKAIIGNFEDYFRWGIAKEIPFEVIKYGNPDNSDAGDLKGHNQVYLRGEAYLGWGILVPSAFAIVKSGISG